MYVLIGSIVMLTIAVTATLVHRVNVRRRVEAERREREEKETQRKALAQKQRVLGDRLFTQLALAAGKNTTANVLGDKAADGYDLIKVERIVDNAGEYSVIPYMPTTQRFNGNAYELFQVDVVTKKIGKEIHIFQCPYGPDAYYPADQFETVLQGLVAYVENYRFFPLDGSPRFDEVFRPAA